MIIGFLRSILLNTIYYKGYIFWENKEYLQYFFYHLTDLFNLTTKAHPVFVLIFSDFTKKFYSLLIRKIDVSNKIYKTLSQMTQIKNNINNSILNINNNLENNYKKFSIDIRIIMINYLESFLHYLIYSKRLYYSYVNICLLKYFNFIYEIIFNKEEDIFFFANAITGKNSIFNKGEKNSAMNNIKNDINVDNKYQEVCNINKIIFKFFLQIGYCFDIDKINIYTYTDEATKNNLKSINSLLENLQGDSSIFEDEKLKSFYSEYNIKPDDYQSQISAVILYLKNFRIRKYDEKTNILELLNLFIKTLEVKINEIYSCEEKNFEDETSKTFKYFNHVKSIPFNNDSNKDNHRYFELENIKLLIKNVGKCLFEIEKQNLFFSSINKFFDVEENINFFNNNIPIRYEKKLESLEKNVFLLKTFLNLKEPKQKFPLLEKYKNLKEKEFIQETIDKVLKKKDFYFSFNLEYKDIVKYFICNLYEVISKKIKDDKKKILNIRKFKNERITNFLDLLDYNNYDLRNFDSLLDLVPQNNNGERISFTGAINFLKISTLFDKEIQRTKLEQKGFDFRDTEYQQLINNKNIEFSKLFENIHTKIEMNSNTTEEDLIYLLK